MKTEIIKIIEKHVKISYKCPNCKRRIRFSISEYKYKEIYSNSFTCCSENMEFDDIEIVE